MATVKFNHVEVLGTYNGGVATYVEKTQPVSTHDKLEYYDRYFRKEIN